MASHCEEQSTGDAHGNAIFVIAGFAVGALIIAVLFASKPAAIAVAAMGVLALLFFLLGDLPDAGRQGALANDRGFFPDAEAVPQEGFWLLMVSSLALALTGTALATLTPAQLAALGPSRRHERAHEPEPARPEPEPAAETEGRSARAKSPSPVAASAAGRAPASAARGPGGRIRGDGAFLAVCAMNAPPRMRWSLDWPPASMVWSRWRSSRVAGSARCGQETSGRRAASSHPSRGLRGRTPRAGQ